MKPLLSKSDNGSGRRLDFTVAYRLLGPFGGRLGTFEASADASERAAEMGGGVEEVLLVSFDGETWHELRTWDTPTVIQPRKSR